MLDKANEEDFKEKIKTPEEERIAIIKEASRRSIIKAAKEYIDTRDRSKLQYIQDLVDELGDAFVLNIPQKDGYAYTVTFNPNEDVPDVPEEK